MGTGEVKHRPTASLAVQSGMANDSTLKGHHRPVAPRRRKGSTTFHLTNTQLIVAAIGTIAIIVLTYYTFTVYTQKHDEALRQEIRRKEIGMLSKDLEKKFEQMDTDNKYLKKRLEDAEQERASLEEKYEVNETKDQKLLKDMELLRKQKRVIQERIQELSRQQVIEKFGKGPFRLEMQLAFDPESNIIQSPGGNRIVIELAPLDDMPHSIFMFLNQVERKLYDGCSFHRNAPHVIQAGPAPNFLTPPNALLEERFEESGLDSVLFQEYSPNFPHLKYTLGYAGRPGGPDWYISVRDNSKIHGPGGQTSYEDPTEADPCFGKVIEGFEAVDRMHAADVKQGSYKHMEHNVAIEHIRLL